MEPEAVVAQESRNMRVAMPARSGQPTVTAS
jgi:hypothetical protein